MSHALYMESQDIAEGLYSVIKMLEASSWRKNLDTIQEKLSHLSERLKTALEGSELPDMGESLQTLRERLQQLKTLVEESKPTTAGLKADWRAYRKRLVATYDSLAISLKLKDIHIPSLRPTNYLRSFYHFLNGVGVTIMIMHLFSPKALVWIAGTAAVWAWSMEIFRRRIPKLNEMLMKVFGKVAHPHEHYRVNSGTWYITALLILSLTVEGIAAAVAVVILGAADPAAALVGRKFGRTKLRSGRSLEGSLTFVFVGMLSALAIFGIYAYGKYSLGAMLLLGFGASFFGAVAELYSQRVDDNFTIPVASALGLSLMALLLGVTF